MRQLMVLAVFTLAAGVVAAQDAGSVNCKAEGTHLCCGTCETSVRRILDKVDGLTAVKVDRKADEKITFEAKSDEVAKNAFTALVNGGFYGKFTARGKDVPIATPKVDAKGDELTFKGVHMCCNSCQTAMVNLFKNDDVAVKITGGGSMKNVTVTGKNLDGQKVLETMQKKGFTGTFEAMKK